MCQLQFTIQTNDVDGDSIKAVQMRYRPELSTNDDDWVVVGYLGVTNVTNETILETPNLTADGSVYEFQVQVRDDDDWGEWFSDPSNPTFKVGNCSKPVANPYYIGVGRCGVTPKVWTPVWTREGSVDDGYTPVVGDILYTNSDLTNPYMTLSSFHRLGFSEPPEVLIINNSYVIDGSGKITSIVGCVTPSEEGNDATIVTPPAEENGCDSCMSVKVDVPLGETREVSIEKTGLAGYSGVSPCRSGTVVFSDMSETISETKTYSFGLDAASGSGDQASSRITLSVSGSNSVRLDRSHVSPVVKC